MITLLETLVASGPRPHIDLIIYHGVLAFTGLYDRERRDRSPGHAGCGLPLREDARLR